MCPPISCSLTTGLISVGQICLVVLARAPQLGSPGLRPEQGTTPLPQLLFASPSPPPPPGHQPNPHIVFMLPHFNTVHSTHTLRACSSNTKKHCNVGSACDSMGCSDYQHSASYLQRIHMLHYARCPRLVAHPHPHRSWAARHSIPITPGVFCTVVGGSGWIGARGVDSKKNDEVPALVSSTCTFHFHFPHSCNRPPDQPTGAT